MSALMHRPHRVYRHYSATGDLLYVGVTSKPKERILGHSITSAWWGDVAYIVYTEPMRREDALALEVHMINLHRPPFNRMVARKSTFALTTTRAAS